jgi:hypothetical protein
MPARWCLKADITKRKLGLAWRYPMHREGLRAILAEEGEG